MFLSAMPVRSCLKSCLLLLCQRSQSAFRSALKHSTLSWHFSTSTGIFGERERKLELQGTSGDIIQNYRLLGLQPQGSGWWWSLIRVFEIWQSDKRLSPILPFKSWESFYVGLDIQHFYFEEIIHPYLKKFLFVTEKITQETTVKLCLCTENNA